MLNLCNLIFLFEFFHNATKAELSFNVFILNIFDSSWLIYNIIVIFVLNFCAILLKNEAKKSLILLHKLERNGLVQHFSMQIEHRPIVVSSGMYDYDWILIYTVSISTSHLINIYISNLFHR